MRKVQRPDTDTMSKASWDSVFTSGKLFKITLKNGSLKRFRDRVREITWRLRRISAQRIIVDLQMYLRGWIGCFHLIETWTDLRDLDSWIRRRLRCFMVRQWINNCHTCHRNLAQLVVGRNQARIAAGSSKGYWHCRTRNR